MATVTADAKSFIIENQRHRIAGGVVGYAGLPRDTWPARIRAAKHAGLNTVVIPVIWADHEPVKGKFRFEDDHDIAHLVRLAAEAGLKVIPRIGPVATADLALGGMPNWIIRHAEADGPLRADTPAFLSRVSKWFNALGKQLAHLQATKPADTDTPNPIIAIEIEHRWACGDPDLADAYLTKLQRYAREGGFNVPTISNNNLFANADGDIEAWSGFANIHAITRQLTQGLPHQPALIADLQLGRTPAWGEHTQHHKDAHACTAALAQTLSAGGQFVIGDFAPAPRLGFRGARLEHTRGAFSSTTNNDAAIINDNAQDPTQSDRAGAVRRIATFATNFQRVFAAADNQRQPTILDPESVLGTVTNERTGERQPPDAKVGPAIESCTGPAGTATFIYSNTAARKHTTLNLVLPTGTPVPVTISEPVRWILSDTHLYSNKHLDICTLAPLALTGSIFVCFAPAGTPGLIQINGTPLYITAPKSKSPAIHQLEGVTILVLNEAQANAAIIEDNAVILNAITTDDQGNYTPASPKSKVTRVIDNGTTQTITNTTPTQSTSTRTLSDWHIAHERQWIDGTDDRYAKIDGPTSLHELGVLEGYAWARVTFNQTTATRAKHALPDAADRIHLYIDAAKPVLLGDGPGITADTGTITPLNLKKGKRTITMLIDDMGRSARADGDERKGVWGHLHEVKPIKAAAELAESEPIDLLDHRAPVFGIHRGDLTNAYRGRWEFTHRRKAPVLLISKDLDWTGAVIVNDKVVKVFVPGDAIRLTLDQDTLKRGKNTVEIAMIGTDEHVKAAWAEINKRAQLFESARATTENAQWALGTWGPPRPQHFTPTAKSAFTQANAKAFQGFPTWFKATFDANTDRGTNIHTTGLSKGQLFINDHNLGRYFNQTPDGKPLPAQHPLWIPQSWLKESGNSLLIFDEHGYPPTKVKITQS